MRFELTTFTLAKGCSGFASDERNEGYDGHEVTGAENGAERVDEPRRVVATTTANATINGNGAFKTANGMVKTAKTANLAILKNHCFLLGKVQGRQDRQDRQWVWGRRRLAVLTMGAEVHRVGTSEAMIL